VRGERRGRERRGRESRRRESRGRDRDSRRRERRGWCIIFRGRLFRGGRWRRRGRERGRRQSNFIMQFLKPCAIFFNRRKTRVQPKKI